MSSNKHESTPRRRRFRRALAVAGLTGALASLSLVVPSSANAAVRAWECSSGYVCVWNSTNGTGSRCTWSSADPDWWGGSVQCSWSDTQNARSAYNRGTSSSYEGVAFYSGANYSGYLGCLPQNGGYDNDFNVRIRSHRWVASC
ncbi:peptidase inhibitor family I36 protein [Streptomyces roseirectus]|uniref:Peptidase inhibitor family I36 protein n=1 Tax=Streptomyces roseirectus TaxID=2768066 RepID=A0A7H0IQP7_9ACTN|nr:peptidase inhibitor family I36 protein [Streptomyces roseirectus]QNP75113.1 peptidase inhibitor family I36 protein [Streptomyces roseirectus]